MRLTRGGLSGRSRLELQGDAGEEGDDEEPAEHVRKGTQHVDAKHGESEGDGFLVARHEFAKHLHQLVRPWRSGSSVYRLKGMLETKIIK